MPPVARALRLGTRRSQLALWQAHHVRDELRSHWGPDLEIELVEIVTKGDQILDKPLALVGGKGLFVNGIEDRLLDARIDFAVHSMKDLPASIPAGLEIVCTPPRANPCDALVGAPGMQLATLPAGTRVGTSSLRRMALARRINPDIEIVSIRGNVPTRVAKIEQGVCDAVILAAAGLERLGLQAHICEVLEFEAFIPAATQGILALEARADDVFTRSILSVMNDKDAADMAATERAFLGHLDGGCQVPMGCHARLEGDTLVANAVIGDPSGRPVYLVNDRAPRDEAEKLGVLLAQRLLDMGAGAVIEGLVAAQAHGTASSS